MKTNSLVVVVFVVLFCYASVFAQTGRPFFEQQIIHARGNSVLIGNTILGNHPKTPFNNIEAPIDQANLCYVDIDKTDTTFSSSAASFLLPQTSNKILYAGLYWGGLCPSKNQIRNREIGKITSNFVKVDRKELVQEVQLKINDGNYEDITGQLIFDSKLIDPFDETSTYACFADVTSQLEKLKDEVSITLANISATSNKIENSKAAGWLLYVVYEDNTQNFKHFKTYSGFKDISKEALVVLFENLPPSTENTLSSKILMATLEEGNRSKGDAFAIFNGSQGLFIPLTSQSNPAQNLFNNTVSNLQLINTSRNPASKNTLGFELLKMNVPDYTITASSTEAILRLSTNSDGFYPFFLAFEIETDKAILKEQKKVPNLAITTSQNSNSPVLLQPSSRKRGQSKIIRNPLGSIHVRQDLFPSPGFEQKSQANFETDKTIVNTPIATPENKEITKAEVPETKPVPIKNEIKEINKKAVPIVQKPTSSVPISTPEVLKAQPIKAISKTNTSTKPTVAILKNKGSESIKKVEKKATPAVANTKAPRPVYTPETSKSDAIKTVVQTKITPKPIVAVIENKGYDPIKMELKKVEKKEILVVANTKASTPVSNPELPKVHPVKVVEKTTPSSIANSSSVKPKVIENNDKTESVSAIDVAPGYYLVSKVFDNETSAVMWKRKLNREGYNAQSFTNNETRQFYIYIEHSATPEKMQSRKQALSRNPVMAKTKVIKVNL